MKGSGLATNKRLSKMVNGVIAFLPDVVIFLKIVRVKIVIFNYVRPVERFSFSTKKRYKKFRFNVVIVFLPDVFKTFSALK